MVRHPPERLVGVKKVRATSSSYQTSKVRWARAIWQPVSPKTRTARSNRGLSLYQVLHCLESKVVAMDPEASDRALARRSDG